MCVLAIYKENVVVVSDDSNFIICDSIILVFFRRILAVVGSKQIRPNSDYQLSVLAQGFKNPENVRVSINGTEVNGRIYSDHRDLMINGDSAQNIVFNVRHLILLHWIECDDIIIYNSLPSDRPEISSTVATSSKSRASMT